MSETKRVFRGSRAHIGKHLPWVCLYCGGGVPKGGRCKQEVCKRWLASITGKPEPRTPRRKGRV